MITGMGVAKAANVTYRKVDRWARSGLLIPSVSKAMGSGSRRYYSTNDVYCASVLQGLGERGMKGKILRRVATAIQQRALANYSWLTIRDSGAVEFIEEDDPDQVILSSTEVRWAVHLATCLQEVNLQLCGGEPI